VLTVVVVENMSVTERKKALSKQRRQAAKQSQSAVKDVAVKDGPKKAGASGTPAKGVDEDPEGQKFVKVRRFSWLA
jgi:hypothetical protein